MSAQGASGGNLAGQNLADTARHRAALGLAHTRREFGLERDARRPFEHHQPLAELQGLVDRMGDEDRGGAGFAKQVTKLPAQRVAGMLVEVTVIARASHARDA